MGASLFSNYTSSLIHSRIYESTHSNIQSFSHSSIHALTHSNIRKFTVNAVTDNAIVIWHHPKDGKIVC